jgi:hypothetical protein
MSRPTGEPFVMIPL